MEKLNWNVIAIIAITAMIAIGTLFILGCLMTGSVRLIMSWICSDYILGLIFGIGALMYLRKSMKEDKAQEKEKA